MSKAPLLGAAAAAILIVALCLTPGPAVIDAEAAPLEDLAVTMLVDPSAEESSVSAWIPRGDYVTPEGERVAVRADSQVQCTGRSGNPRWSRQAMSMQAKTEVRCTGSGVEAVTVRVISYLGKAADRSGAGMEIIARSDYSQTVRVGGTDGGTWYVPAEDSPRKVRAGGWFKASHAGKVAGDDASIGAASSQVVAVRGGG